MKLPLFAKRLLGAVVGSALAVGVYGTYEFAAPKLTAHFLQQTLPTTSTTQVPGGVTVRPKRSTESMHGIAPEQEKAQQQVGEDAKKILERLMQGQTTSVSSNSSISSISPISSPELPLAASVMETSTAIEHSQSGDNLSKSGVGEWVAVFAAFALTAFVQRGRLAMLLKRALV